MKPRAGNALGIFCLLYFSFFVNITFLKFGEIMIIRTECGGLPMYEYEFVKVNTKSSNRHYYDVVGNYAKSGWRLHQVLNNQKAQEGSCVELIFERELHD